MQFVQIELPFGSNELVQRLLRDIGFFDGAVELGSVAGGNDRSFADPTVGRCAQALAQAANGCANLVGQKGDALAYCEWSSRVVKPEGEELHRRSRWPLSRLDPCLHRRIIGAAVCRKLA